MGRELLRRPADDVDAEIAERLLDLWIIERGRERAIERGDHVLRRVRGRHQAVPGGGVEILDPELVDGRNIGQDRGALEGRDRERSDFPVPDMGHHGRGGRKHHLHVAGDHILQRRRRALVELVVSGNIAVTSMP